jgi:phosphoribosylamine-glycine ligase
VRNLKEVKSLEEFLVKHNIPNAETVEKGCDFLETLKPPCLKADGLAAGKGVLIIHVDRIKRSYATCWLTKNLVPRVQKSLSKSSLTELN